MAPGAGSGHGSGLSLSAPAWIPLRGGWEGKCLCEGEGPLSAGEHRGLGAGVSKVRSLKMDRKVWTETLIEVGRPCLSPGFGARSAACCLGLPTALPLLTDLGPLELEETFAII